MVRGGVPVAVEVADRLPAPLDVLIVRKLGVPWAPEVAFGALGPAGVKVLNERVVERLEPLAVRAVLRREQAELGRRERQYRGGRPPLDLAGRTGNGEWVVNGKTTYFTYEFQRGGTVIYRSNRETLNGSWTQSGNSVTVQVGVSYEVGTLSGNKLVLRCNTGNVGEGVATLTFRD